MFYVSLKACIQTFLIPIFTQQITLLVRSETREGPRVKYMFPLFNFD